MGGGGDEWSRESEQLFLRANFSGVILGGKARCLRIFTHLI